VSIHTSLVGPDRGSPAAVRPLPVYAHALARRQCHTHNSRAGLGSYGRNDEGGIRDEEIRSASVHHHYADIYVVLGCIVVDPRNVACVLRTRITKVAGLDDQAGLGVPRAGEDAGGHQTYSHNKGSVWHWLLLCPVSVRHYEHQSCSVIHNRNVAHKGWDTSYTCRLDQSSTIVNPILPISLLAIIELALP
jgi:hypothetical protein